MSVVHEHPKHGKLELVADADTLTQGQLEAFNNAWNDLESVKDGFSRNLRAAIAAGWIVAPTLTAEQVNELTARQVRWYGKVVDGLYAEVVKPDPKA